MDLYKLKQIQQNIVKELKDAHAGKKTSFPYIVHQIPNASLVKDNEIFQVLVFGGSITLNALLKRRGKHLVMLKRQSKGQRRFLSQEDFFKLIFEEFDPSVSVLAVNLAYPLKPVFDGGKLDGILVAGSKENTFHGLVGKQVGKEIERFIFEKTGKKVMVSAANDTVCLLLSGLTEVATHNIAGGILGTGMNFAFFLKDNKLVNLEAANFDKFPQTEDGKIVDQESAEPGRALLEKETSGAYLYKHFNVILKRDKINYPPIESTLELDRILEDKSTEVYPIAKMLLERSAGLVACMIGGITAFKGQDMVFVMEGSLFWNATGYRRYVKDRLLHLVPQYGITFIKIEDSPIYGAGKLVS